MSTFRQAKITYFKLARPDDYKVSKNLLIIKERKFLSILSFLPNLEVEHSIGIGNIELKAKPTGWTIFYWIFGIEVGDIYVSKENQLIHHLRHVINFRDMKTYIDDVKG